VRVCECCVYVRMYRYDAKLHVRRRPRVLAIFRRHGKGEVFSVEPIVDIREDGFPIAMGFSSQFIGLETMIHAYP
jgi:hypothetical protein